MPWGIPTRTKPGAHVVFLRTVVLYNCDNYDWKNVDNSINNASKLSVLKVNH